MRQRMIWAGASLAVLAACSGSADPIGENSAGSIRTTAIGNVVAAIPTPTPTPTPQPVLNMAEDTATEADMAGNAM